MQRCRREHEAGTDLQKGHVGYGCSRSRRRRLRSEVDAGASDWSVRGGTRVNGTDVAPNQRDRRLAPRWWYLGC